MQSMQQFIYTHTADLIALVRQLCQIPAPSHQEQQRAAFCKAWLEANGADNVRLDDAQNVICPVGVTEDNDVVVFMAHMDTVFPDREPMPMHEDGGRLFCPGVGDDTANLAILLMATKYMLESRRTPVCGVIFCANSCEEGLGNLKGCRALMEAYGARVRQVISFDLGLDTVFTKAVGSARYRIQLKTEGGHSYLDFGKPNAILEMAKLIQALYALPMPDGVTCNVGTIAGGTSVNTIAQQAEILYEYRAANDEHLAVMHEHLQRLVAVCPVEVSVQLLGLRPGMAPCHDPAAQEKLICRIEDIVQSVTGCRPRRISGSTDCNIPFSQGIPAACVGLVNMSGAHTRTESIDLASLPLGLAVALRLIAPYFTEN